MIKTTRQRILDHLSTHGSASATELASALQVTPADARHHLANLRAEGLVVRSDPQTAPGHPVRRGRPARLYSLPAQSPDQGLAHLLLALLDETYSLLPASDQETLLRRLAARLGGLPSPPAGLSQRLVVAVQRLDQLGYRARWEARASGPRLILDHRPFASLEAQHPELALLEAYLIEQLLGSQAARVEIVHPASS